VGPNIVRATIVAKRVSIVFITSRFLSSGWFDRVDLDDPFDGRHRQIIQKTPNFVLYFRILVET
jgi:hypothetical protein